MLTKQKALLGRSIQAESSKVREPKELLCPMVCGLSRVLLFGKRVNFQGVSGQSLCLAPTLTRGPSWWCTHLNQDRFQEEGFWHVGRTCQPHLLFRFSSVTQSCLTLCDPMNHSMPGLPVHHQLPEFTQTHVHQVGDAIQPSHPLSSPSPPVPNPSQHQGLFQ